MAEVFHSTFDSDTDGFTGGTYDASVGSAAIGAAAGALRVGAGVTAYRDFTTISSGDVRLDCWAYESNTTTASSTAAIVYLLENGAAVNSANTAGCVFVDRASAVAGATTTAFKFGYRDSTGFVYSNTFNVPKGQWYKLSVITRISSKTFDIALDDVILIRGAAWANASATGVGRVAFAGSASAPDTWFDNVRVESSWTEGESVIVDHDFVGGSGEIEDSLPTTYRDAHAQKWFIPPDASNYGGFTLGANGATPDASKNCIALQRCSANGILELEFKTPSSGTAYAGIAFRFWDYFSSTNGGGGLVRVSGSDNTVALLLPDKSGTLKTVASVALTPSANTTYTLRLEMRGRVFVASYKAAAMDSGSYTTAITHTVKSSVTGGRGMLIEELAGPFVASAVGTADIRRFRATGKAEPSEAVRTIGDYKLQVGHGSVKELYYLDSAAPTNNLFWSRGIQYGHRSSADMCGAQQQQVIYDETNLYAARQTGGNVTEYQHLGKADCYITLLMRGPWISDGILPTDVSENFAPDFDLRPSRWSTAFLSAISSGSATSRSDASYHDWTVHNSSVSLPAGNQSLSAFGSGQEFHASQVVLADGTVPTSAWGVTSKFEGNGDPISRAISTGGSNLTAGTALRVARAFLFRAASALSATVLEEWRDSLASPGTLSFTTGSAKTDASGDTGADGFNERHGWYEIMCASGAAIWTLPVASGTRFWPAFRLHGWDSESTVVSIDGSPATAGTDYVLDDCGGGVAVLQLLADYTSNVDVAVSAGGTTVSAGVGDAAAAGHSAAVTLPKVVAAGVGAASAAGHAATVTRPTPIAAGVGAAVAAGHAAGLVLATGVQAAVGAAAAEGQAASVTAGVTLVSAGVGSGSAAGLTATVAPTTTVATSVGAAAAAGAAAAVGADSVTVSAGVGSAAAAGAAASIVLATTVSTSLGAASAQGLQATVEAGSITVSAGVGAGAAVGVGASVSAAERILASIGAATGAGASATVASSIVVAAAAGAATAEGLAAQLRTGLSISCGLGQGLAQGWPALIEGSGHTPKGSLQTAVYVAPDNNAVFVPYENRTIYAS